MYDAIENQFDIKMNLMYTTISSRLIRIPAYKNLDEYLEVETEKVLNRGF